VSLGRSIAQQRTALESFKNAVEMRDAQVKARTAADWSEFEQVLANTLNGFAAEIQNAEVQDGEWVIQRQLVAEQRGGGVTSALDGNDAMMG